MPQRILPTRSWSLIAGFALLVAVMGAAALFVELQQVRALRDQADMEWGRLQLELATSGSLGRVMHIASERLQMRVPDAGKIVVVR